MKLQPRLVLGAVGGAWAGLCWLPLGLAPLFPIPYFLAMQGLRRTGSAGEAVRYGLLFGAARYIVASHFLLALVEYSLLGVGFYLLAICFILPFAVIESWGAWWLERYCRLPRSIGFGMLYALLEWVRTIGDMSFPADLLAHGFGTNPAWLGWSPWIGSFGVTLLIMAVAALFDVAWERRKSLAPALVATAAGVSLWTGPVMTDMLTSPRLEKRIGRSLQVGIVQPSITVEDKFDPANRSSTWNRLRHLTMEAAESADLVLWPESARPEPVIMDTKRPFNDPPMEALARSAGVPILYGCEIAGVDGKRITGLYNGAAIAFPDGRPGAWYGKQQLLPFAEGVPFADLFGYDPYARSTGERKRSYLTMMGNFTAGTVPALFEVDGARIGVLICFEGMYPTLARRYILDGGNTLVLLTNDRWWGRSVFAKWHARMVSSLARELNVPVIRAANSGVSSVTGSNGRMTASTGLFEVTVLSAEFSPGGGGATFYTRAGDVLIWAILAVLGMLITRAASEWLGGDPYQPPNRSAR